MIKNLLGGFYKGTVAAFGLAVVILVLWTVLIIENKPVPDVFQYILVALTGVGGAIAASGTSSGTST